MKRGFKLFLLGVMIVVLLLLSWFIWQTQINIDNSFGLFDGGAEVVLGSTLFKSPSPEPVVTRPSREIVTLPPTWTPVLKATELPIPTVPPPPSAVPTATSTSIPVITNTSVPIVTSPPIFIDDGIDRTCPNPAPLKPAYSRYYVPSQSLPLPTAGGAEHRWLSKPLPPGGGRLLYTTWFPYGSDGSGRYLLHNGIDVSEPLGTPVLSMAPGTVIVAGDDYSRLYGWRCDWYGHLVVIELDQTWLNQPVYVLYGHVLEISVEVGQRVNTGDQVATVGVGGAATAPHLHFEVRVGTNEFGSTRNPLLWLQPVPTRGVLAGRLIDPLGRPWQGVVIDAINLAEEGENYTTWSYLGDPQHLINSDETFAENFVIGDVQPGRYEIVVTLQGTVYREEVEIAGGNLSTVEIVTEHLKTSTPTPIPAETPGTPSEAAS